MYIILYIQCSNSTHTYNAYHSHRQTVLPPHTSHLATLKQRMYAAQNYITCVYGKITWPSKSDLFPIKKITCISTESCKHCTCIPCTCSYIKHVYVLGVNKICMTISMYIMHKAALYRYMCTCVYTMYEYGIYSV